MTGKAYHPKHGEWFYLENPKQGDLFLSKDVITATPAVEIEAKSMDWDLHNLVHYLVAALVFRALTL
jgi:hypothetical protein